MNVLRAHEVRFVVIGGFSLAAHGYVRGTKEIDITPAPARADLVRLLRALEELAAEPLALGDFKPSEILELKFENLELGSNWPLRTRYGRLDVMQDVPGLKSYAQLREGAIEPDLPDLESGIPFAGLDDLIVSSAPLSATKICATSPSSSARGGQD